MIFILLLVSAGIWFATSNLPGKHQNLLTSLLTIGILIFALPIGVFRILGVLLILLGFVLAFVYGVFEKGLSPSERFFVSIISVPTTIAHISKLMYWPFASITNLFIFIPVIAYVVFILFFRGLKSQTLGIVSILTAYCLIFGIGFWMMRN